MGPIGPWSGSERDQGKRFRSVFSVEPVLAPWVIIVVTRGLISVCIIVSIAEIAMISAVFSATLKTFIVSTRVLVRQLVMIPVVRTITVVFIVVSERGNDRCAQH